MSDFEKYFKVVGILPGIVHTPKFGKVDLRTISVEKALEMYKDGFNYLELTDEGKKKLDPDPPPANAKDLVQSIKDSQYRVEVLDLMAQGETLGFASVKKAGDTRLNQLDNNKS